MWSSAIISLKEILSSLSALELNEIDEKGFSLLSHALLKEDSSFVEFLLKNPKINPNQHAFRISFQL